MTVSRKIKTVKLTEKYINFCINKSSDNQLILKRWKDKLEKLHD